MVLEVTILTVLLNNVCPIIFFNNLMERDDVGMVQCFQEFDLYGWGVTSWRVLVSMIDTFLAMK
jgi:hypothetical protein